MDDAVLDISFRKYSFYSLREACQIICAGDKDILNTSVAQTVQNACPELCAFIFTDPHTENVLPAVHINAYRYIYSLFDDLSFTAYMVVDSVEKYDCIDAFKRSMLPFLCNREDLVCDTADGGIRYLQTVNITDMVLNIGR
ncbi:MAG: hypothetical protein BWZ04_01559 [Firmicutes bacterium ADurb.BinA205]|nr:MAG: hypothetical protein BWZ04_01559 [Firmicutes bacterium ADurb.BinA205]